MRISLPRQFKIFVGTVTILSSVVLALYVYLGTFIRMIADDYCSAQRGLELGPFQGVIERYMNWSSRYSGFFIEYTLAPLRPSIHVWLTLLTIVAWLAAFYYFFDRISSWLDLPQKSQISIILAILSTFYFYLLIPLDQHIFWFAAVIPYVWVLILTVTLIGNFIHYFTVERTRITKIAMLIYVALMVLFLGGFVEIQITIMVTVFALMLLAIPLVPAKSRRECGTLFAVALMAALVALVIVLAAPGPEVRQTALLGNVPELTLADLAITGSKLTWLYIQSEVIGKPFVNTTTINFNVLVMYCTFVFAGLVYIEKYPDARLIAPRSLTKSFLAVVLVGLILIVSTIYPMYYASRGLPLRAIIFPRFIVFCFVMALAYLTLVALQRRKRYYKMIWQRKWPVLAIIVAFVILIPPVLTINRYISYIPNFQTYAVSWDKRHETLVNAGDNEAVIIKPLAYDLDLYLGLERLTGDPNFWINQCAASYYNLESIRVMG